MKTHTATLASAIFVPATSITYAASTTVNINAIDANGIGKKIGTLRHGEGHKGDVPVLTVDGKGRARKVVIAPHLTVADVKSRSIMIHAGGDNYSDQPSPLGGGGARIACGVIK